MSYFFQKYLAHMLFIGVVFNLSSLFMLKAANNKIISEVATRKHKLSAGVDIINENINLNHSEIRSVLIAYEICKVRTSINASHITTDTIHKLIFNKNINKLIIQNGTFTNGSIVTPLFDTLNISTQEVKTIRKICQDYYIRQNKKNQNPLGI